MNRRELMLLPSGAMVAAPALRAQQKATPVIGYLGNTSLDPNAPLMAAFRQGLSETGYVEGRNLTIEYRWAEGNYDRLPALAADLVGRKVDVIVAGGTTAVLEAKNATSTIPIVFVSADPLGEGSGRQSRPAGWQSHGRERPHRRADGQAARTAFRASAAGQIDPPTGEPTHNRWRTHDQRHAGSGECQGSAAPYPQGQH